MLKIDVPVRPLGLASALVLALMTACGGGSGSGSDVGAVAISSAVPALNVSTTAVASTTVPSADTTADPLETLTAADRLLSARELLGKRIFSDANLSEPRGTACVSCHQANLGFAGNNGGTTGVARGSLGLLGFRNAMTNAYSGLVPAFGFLVEDGKTEAVGGHFWDGRADTLALQALQPFLNPLEMNNASAQVVVSKIATSRYAAAFRQEFGADVFANPATAFEKVGVAIEAFERSAQLEAFSSKYDFFIKGQVTLSPAEQRGMALFTDPLKANCAGCHVMNAASANPKDSPFSEFTYYATGVPRNMAIAQNANPNFFDLGLCGPERAKPVLTADVPASFSVESLCGMFRMPTLRNVAQRPAFMHNGVFTNLRDAVRFYSIRISNPERIYGAAGVPNDLPPAYVGNIEKTKPPFNRSRADGPVLTEAEITDVISFLGTLSDGYTPPAPADNTPRVPPRN